MASRDFSKCPRCGAATAPAIAFNGAESEFWLECTKCNTFINTYIPQEHQEAVHKDTHRFVGNFGAYGSGKTTTSRQEFYKHVLITPHGNTLIGANVASQYEQTIKRDIEADIPQAFIDSYSTQKQYMDFINGHRVIYRPYDDPNKLRSYNLSMFIIVEASEVKQESFTQLKTRLRHLAATVPLRDEEGNIQNRTTKRGVQIPIIKADWRKGIIESNPSAGWIRSDVLFKSSDIQKHGEVADTYAVMDKEKDPAISTHITTCDVNEFLPPTFKQDIMKNKPLAWVQRYVYGSFMYADGMVYPTYSRNIIPTFEIPRHWKRGIAFDYGLADNSAFLFAAVDEEHNQVVLYKEVVVNDKSVETLARLFKQETKDIPFGGMFTQPLIDPKSGPRRDYDKKTLSAHFLDFGIAFKPGAVNKDARVFRTNTYFESGKLKIMDCCVKTLEELSNYKYSQRNFSEEWSDKPEDGNDHCISALEWIIMELPANPARLIYGVYDRQGNNLEENPDKNPETMYWQHALSDDEEEDDAYEGPYDIIDYNF